MSNESSEPLSEAQAPYEWYYSDKPMPCPCGKSHLVLRTTYKPKEKGYGDRRQAIECLACGEQGPDTCHGKKHAARRWNWMWYEKLTDSNEKTDKGTD